MNSQSYDVTRFNAQFEYVVLKLNKKLSETIESMFHFRTNCNEFCGLS